MEILIYKHTILLVSTFLVYYYSILLVGTLLSIPRVGLVYYYSQYTTTVYLPVGCYTLYSELLVAMETCSVNSTM